MTNVINVFARNFGGIATGKVASEHNIALPNVYYDYPMPLVLLKRINSVEKFVYIEKKL